MIGLSICVSIASVGSPIEFSGVEIEMSTTGITMGTEEPAFEIGELAMHQLELRKCSMASKADLAAMSKSDLIEPAVASPSVGPDRRSALSTTSDHGMQNLGGN